jgi:hypothetical protein
MPEVTLEGSTYHTEEWNRSKGPNLDIDDDDDDDDEDDDNNSCYGTMSYKLSNQARCKIQFHVFPLIATRATEAETYLPTMIVLTAFKRSLLSNFHHYSFFLVLEGDNKILCRVQFLGRSWIFLLATMSRPALSPSMSFFASRLVQALTQPPGPPFHGLKHQEHYLHFPRLRM